jgi:hypothetical protein
MHYAARVVAPLKLPSRERHANFRKPTPVRPASVWPVRAILLAFAGIVASAWALHRHFTLEKPVLVRPAPTEFAAPPLETLESAP